MGKYSPNTSCKKVPREICGEGTVAVHKEKNALIDRKLLSKRSQLKPVTWNHKENANMLQNWFLFSNHQKNVSISQLKLVPDPEPTQERYKNQSSRNGVTYQLLNLVLPKIFNANSILFESKIIDALALTFSVNLKYHSYTAKN